MYMYCMGKIVYTDTVVVPLCRNVFTCSLPCVTLNILILG